MTERQRLRRSAAHGRQTTIWFENSTNAKMGGIDFFSAGCTVCCLARSSVRRATATELREAQEGLKTSLAEVAARLKEREVLLQEITIA